MSEENPAQLKTAREVHPVIAAIAAKKTPEAVTRAKLHQFLDARKDFEKAPEPLLKKIYAPIFLDRLQAWNDKGRTNQYAVDLQNNPRLDAEDVQAWLECSTSQAVVFMRIVASYGFGEFKFEDGKAEEGVLTVTQPEILLGLEPKKETQVEETNKGGEPEQGVIINTGAFAGARIIPIDVARAVLEASKNPIAATR